MYQSVDNQSNGPYVFISYAHLDSNRVLPSIFELMDRGYRVWYDAGIEAGTEWPEYIAERLYESHAIVVFISKYYLYSQNCLREIKFAAQLKKKIILVFLENLIIPDNIKKLLSNATVLYNKSSFSHDNFMLKICELDIMSKCKGEITNQTEDFDVSIEDDLFYAKECKESGRDKEARQRLQRAADKGSAEALYQLSEYYRWDERGNVAKDMTEAARLCRLAAEAGHPAAQKQTGCDYLNGNGVIKDYREAVKWFRKSAEAGFAEGQYMLASCYQEGEGVEKNLKEARYWYTKSAEQGFSYSKTALQVLDSIDDGYVPNNYVKKMLELSKYTSTPIFVDTNDVYDESLIDDNIDAILDSFSDEELISLLSSLMDDDF